MRNGAGVYSLPAPPSPFVDGQKASATDMMTVLNDIATAMTASLAADGQTPITGTLDFDGNDANDIGAATAATLVTSKSAAIGTTLTVTGATTLSDTLSVGGSATFIASAKFGAAVSMLSTLAVTGVATAANGTTGSQVVNYSQFPTTTGSPGTMTYPSGLIRKWGTGNTTNGAGSVTFATAFPTACDNVQITISGGSATHSLTSVIAGTLSAAGFDAWGKTGETLSFYWEAVGR